MACRRCDSASVREFSAEINIHFLSPRDLNRPQVLLFPKILVCSHCGFTEFNLCGEELRLLMEDPPAVRLSDEGAA